MKLYKVDYETAPSFVLHCYVAAESMTEAIDIWRKYYDLTYKEPIAVDCLSRELMMAGSHHEPGGER